MSHNSILPCQLLRAFDRFVQNAETHTVDEIFKEALTVRESLKNVEIITPEGIRTINWIIEAPEIIVVRTDGKRTYITLKSNLTECVGFGIEGYQLLENGETNLIYKDIDFEKPVSGSFCVTVDGVLHNTLMRVRLAVPNNYVTEWSDRIYFNLKDGSYSDVKLSELERSTLKVNTVREVISKCITFLNEHRMLFRNGANVLNDDIYPASGYSDSWHHATQTRCDLLNVDRILATLV